MNPRATIILEQLAGVAAERAQRAADPALDARAAAIKQYQQRRFASTHADLLASARYGAASRFFLEELYGPRDFTRRDQQFARVVPAMVRLFPREVIDTVADLATLHALTEQLDSLMARNLDALPVGALGYAAAWRAGGQPQSRERQIVLTVGVGASIDRLTHRALLRRSLHLMRGPARAAGLGALQAFLESGFDTFKAMNGADEFLATVGSRERSLAAALFASDATSDLLGQLP